MKPITRFFVYMFALFVVLPCVAAENTMEQQGDTLQHEIQAILLQPLDSCPVVMSGDTLFFVYGGLGGIKVEKRAAIVSENIAELKNIPFFDADSLIAEDDAECRIVYKQNVIFAVTDQQADYLRQNKTDLAEAYCARIVDAVTAARSTIVWQTVLKRIGEGILLVLVTFFLLKYLNILYRKTRAYILTRKDKTIKKLYYLLDADKQVAIGAAILRFLRLGLYVLIFYFFLLLLFLLVPGTRWLSDRLLGYIISPLKSIVLTVWNFIPDLIVIIIITFIFRLIIKAIHAVSEKVSNGSITINGFHAEWTSATFNIIRVILYIFMFILIFPHLPNSDTNIFQGVSVFVGVLISLGSTSLIGNLMAGLVITYMRPFKIGDRIRVGENLGNVIEKSSLVTRIKTTKNEIVTIPNSSIMSAQTINYTASATEYGLILHTAITMGYEISWRRMHELLIEAAMKTPDVLTEPKPFVLQTALDDFYVRYEINVYTSNANEMIRIYSDLNKNIQDIFNREGIELMAPHIYGYRKMDRIAIPEEYNHPET